MDCVLGSSVVGLMATSSKRAYVTGCMTHVCCTQNPCSCGRPLLTCTSSGDTQTQVWLSLCGVSGSWCTQDFVWAFWKPLMVRSLHGKQMREHGCSGRLYFFFFFGFSIIADGDCSHEIKRRLLLGSETMKNLDSLLKRHYFASEGLFSQSCDFSSSHVWMWELDYKESWVMKNPCFWTIVLESPLDFKDIQPAHHKGNQSWIFVGRSDAEAPIPRSPDVKNWLIGKDPDVRKDWRGGKGTTENEMVGWHHLLDGHEFEQALWVGDGQGSLACCSPRVCRESGTTEWLNWTETTNLKMNFLLFNLHSQYTSPHEYL